MASSFNINNARLLQWCLFCIVLGTTNAQLSNDFYKTSCPQAFSIIESKVRSIMTKKPFMGATLLQAHVMDCFFGGCDGSILLNESMAMLKRNTQASVFTKFEIGFEAIDAIKAQVEKECPGVVSCADVLAVVARDTIATYGGPKWQVPLGRRDSDQALKFQLESVMSVLLADLNTKIAAFNKFGFTKEEYVALQGGHTIGKARCIFFKKRIHEKVDIDPKYAEELKSHCPLEGGDDNYAPLDATTPFVFDNAYYTNVINKRGLLPTDQELYTGKGGTTDAIVTSFSSNITQFFDVFSQAFVKIGKMQIVTGTNGEVRKNCRVK